MSETQQIISSLENELSLQLDKNINLEELTIKLSEWVNRLIQHDFNKLVRLLYKVDVSESRLKSLWKENPNEDAGRLIASLIIERQIQKIKTRNYFKSNRDE